MYHTYRLHTLRILIASMAAIAIIVGASAVTLLYRTAYDETLLEMQRSANTLANLLEAVAQFDKRYSEHTNPQGHWGATMSQIEAGMLMQNRAKQTSEIIVGRRLGSTMQLLRAIPGKGLQEVARVPFDGVLARPLFLALHGERGSGELPDYSGTSVLAGYAPVPTLGIGIVYKIDTATVKAPFIRASLWAGLIGALLIALGAWIFTRVTRPLLRRVEQSEQRFSALVTGAPVGVYETDLKGHCTFVNARWCQLAGLSAQQAMGEGWVKALHPEDAQQIFSAWQDFVERDAPFALEYRFQRPDGSASWLFGQASKLTDKAGNLRGYTGTVTDISELKSAQQELELYRSHLEQLISQRTAMLEDAQRISHMGNWNWDVASGKLTWSDEIFRIFGHLPKSFEPSYERFIAALHPEDVEHIKESERLAFARGARHSIDHRIVLPDGTVRWVHEEAIATVDANGQALSLTGTVQDITERKHSEALLLRAKEEAERANAAKSKFLSRMSHELRTPMNAILGFAQVLELEALNPEQQSFVAEIYQAGKHLLALIDELLDLSRIEAGKLATRIAPVHLGPVLQNALGLAEPIIKKQRISVINQCPAEVVVLADATRLRQIMFNLISNAAKYNRDGGSIHINCQAHGDLYWRISVTDTGPGIAPDKLDNIFTPFERLGAELTTVAGTGIGLSLCQKLAELMGAELGVNSTQGKGSTFWIDLPRAATMQAAPETTPAGAVDMKRIKVLYIEDNAANLKVVETMLRRHPDISLISASNGEYGLELARRYRPDAILLDIHLPGMDGYAVLAALKADSAMRDIPVLALSADAMPIDIEIGLKAGFARYLTKPVKLEELLEALLAALLVDQMKPACS